MDGELLSKNQDDRELERMLISISTGKCIRSYIDFRTKEILLGNFQSENLLLQ